MAGELSTGRLLRGVAAGSVASVVMGISAMIASIYHDTGSFTPLYHIASSVGSPAAMMESMTAATAGDSAFFVAGPALLGALIHMMVGALAGIAFVALASLRQIGRMSTVVAGVAFGLILMLVNTLLVLPVTAHVLGGGDPIAEMGAVAGWLTFTVEHALFGLVLGLLVSALSPPATQPAAAFGARAVHG
jgi:tetrahydromethanopterin S-methyltransferase subunit G